MICIYMYTYAKTLKGDHRIEDGIGSGFLWCPGGGGREDGREEGKFGNKSDD